MKYTRVRRAVSAVMIDSYDEDRNPELVKVNGTVTFTPLLKDGDVVQWAGPNGPQSLVLAPIECFISNGIIMHRGGEGIFLAAGGPGVQPDVIQWKATFKNMQAGGWAFNLKPVMFDAVPDGEVDLTLVSPIAGASEPIVRGPAGVGLKSITVDGSELVVTVTSEAGTYVMSRIPLEDVVRAEADQAVASVQTAIKADVDAAAASASAAKSSEDAAAKSATDAQNAASQTVASAQAAIKADVDAAAKSASDAQTAASKTVESAQTAIQADVDAAAASASAAANSAAAAKSSQETAAASASAAQASAATATTQAETATTQAGTAMEQANAADMSAENAKTYAANAKASETSAGESAAIATSEADRAKMEADRAAQKATEVANTVEGNFSPIGHHHLWSEIDNKPSTFPPATHTHTVSQITNLDNGFAGVSISTSASGNAVVKRDGLGNVVVPATPGYDTSAASKAYVDAQDLKIDELGSAVDLDTITTTGAYQQNLNDGAANGKNYPVNLAGLLEVFNPDDDLIYQRYTVYSNNNKVFTRGSDDGKWSGWKELSTTGHTHTTAQVTGLQSALDGKAAKSHTHTTAQVTGLDTALAGKASQADMVALQARLAGIIPYAVMMTGSEGGQNPIIVAGTSHQRGLNTRIAIPKGVSQVQLTTPYKGTTTLVLTDGARNIDVKWWPENPGGINMVEAVGNDAYIYLRAADATTSDTFSLVIIPMSDQN